MPLQDLVIDVAVTALPLPVAPTSDVFGPFCLGAAHLGGSAMAAAVRPLAAPLTLGPAAGLMAEERRICREHTQVGTDVCGCFVADFYIGCDREQLLTLSGSHTTLININMSVQKCPDGSIFLLFRIGLCRGYGRLASPAVFGKTSWCMPDNSDTIL